MAKTLLRTFGVLGASRIGDDPQEAVMMRNIGRVLAKHGREIYVGCATGQLQQLLLGALEMGGKFKIFLIPEQQLGSVRVCEEHGFDFIEVDRDNTRTLKLLNCDAWLSGYMSTGSIGETARAATWNQDRGIRDHKKTPHFYLDRSMTNRYLVAAYKAAVQEGRAGADVVNQLFIEFSDTKDLVKQILNYENSKSVDLSSRPSLP